jgi:hypothetical protein
VTGLALLEALPEGGDVFPGVVFAGEFDGGAEFAGDSEVFAGAPFTLADGGTGTVDAAGLVLFAGDALVSCAGTCDCGALTGVNDVPFWPAASVPANNTNTTCQDTLPTIRLRTTQKGEKQMNFIRLAHTVQLFTAIRHLST